MNEKFTSNNYEIDKDKIELFNLFDFKKDAILRDHYY